jgi:hypothetical protein
MRTEFNADEVIKTKEPLGGRWPRASAHHLAGDVAASLLIEAVSSHPEKCGQPELNEVALVPGRFFE